MTWFWPLRNVLRSRLLGAEGEILESQEWRLYGTHSVLSSTEISWTPWGLRLEIPSDTRVTVENEEICRNAYGAQLSLQWRKLPSAIQLEFGNRCRLELELAKANNWLPAPLSRRAWVWSSVVCAHAFALGLAFFGAQDSMQTARERLEIRQKKISLAKLDIGLDLRGSSASSKTERAAPPTADQRMRRLMDSWGAGKPIQHANVVLPKETKRGSFGRNLDLNGAGGWRSLNSEDGVEGFGVESSDLNISDAQISNAFAAITPRVKECYDDVLIRDSAFTGKPDIWIDIGLSGRVEEVHIENLQSGKSDSIPRFRSCLKTAYRAVRLPLPNQAFSVRYSLILQQS